MSERERERERERTVSMDKHDYMTQISLRKRFKSLLSKSLCHSSLNNIIKISEDRQREIMW